jgi:Ca-activated chloride channel family protein
MDFAQPAFLYCFIPLALLGVLVWYLARRKDAALARIGAPGLIARLSASVNRAGRRWKTVLWFVALSFVVLTLARPRWGNQVEYVERRGVEIMVALDVSESMLAEDLKPNRLARAKLEITELMDQLEGNAIGLVLFSGAAFVQFPLTSDFATARTFLESAQPGIISRPGTAVAEAIEIALTGFDEERATQKVIILLTDGESHEGDYAAAAQAAADQGIIIYAIGFGSPDGEPIPQYDFDGNLVDYKRDHTGEIVLSRLDETALQEIALTTGGSYYRAVPDGREIGFLADAIGELQTSELESRFETRRVERFQWFLGLAVLALAVGELIPERLSTRPAKARQVAGLPQEKLA